MNLRKGLFAKIWTGFKATTREDINHMTSDIRELLSPPDPKGQLPEPEKVAVWPLTGAVVSNGGLCSDPAGGCPGELMPWPLPSSHPLTSCQCLPLAKPSKTPESREPSDVVLGRGDSSVSTDRVEESGNWIWGSNEIYQHSDLLWRTLGMWLMWLSQRLNMQ